MTHQTHAHHLVSPRPQPLSGAVHVQERSFGRGQGFFPRGRAALLLPATNPLSKVLTLFPVPPPFPRGPHFLLSLGNGPAQLAEVCSPRAGAPSRLLADLPLPPLTSLLRRIPSLGPPSQVSRLVPKSSFFNVRETLGAVSTLLWLYQGPAVWPLPAPASLGLGVLGCGEKGGSGGIHAVRRCPERVHPRFVLQVELFCYSWA